MREEEIDRKIKAALSQHIELSHTYQNMVRTTLQEQKKKKKTRIKAIKTFATSCTCVLVITSIVYAKDISNWVQNFFNYSKGIDTAIENGYIANPNMEYINSNGTEAKIENFLMDDYNLSFTLDLKFDENVNVNEIARISIPDIIITDEENRIIHCENKEIFDKFCKENSLDYKYKNFNENYINSVGNWYIKEKNIDEDTIKLVYNFYGDIYPKSKKLNINFSKINLSEKEDYEQINTAIIGKWNINIDVPEKFYNREAIIYKVKNCSNKNINVTEAVVYETCMKLSLDIQENKIYDDNDSEEIIKEKIRKKVDEEKAKEEIQTDKIGPFYKNSYVEVDKGKRFYAVESNSEDSGYSEDYITGVVKFWQTFNLTKYDATKTLKIYLNYKDEDIWIELER